MSTQLLQILRFINVGAGVTATLPHTLNLADVPAKPDILIPSTAGDFTIDGATDATVTVTNHGDAPASIDVWVERKHSIPRELGAPLDHMTPQPFIATGSGGTAAPTAPTTERKALPSGGAVAASPDVDVTYVDGTHGDITLANGTVDGFEKTVCLTFITDGNTTITPANGPVLTFVSGESGSAILRWGQTEGNWFAVSQFIA